MSWEREELLIFNVASIKEDDFYPSFPLKITWSRVTGDTWDSLLTERPKLLKPPAPVSGARLMSFEDFYKASAEVTKLTTQTRRHSTSK